MKNPKIGIFGHYGNRNLGDEAIIEAIIQNIKERRRDCEIVCLSLNPFDSRDRHKVESFPIRFRRDFFVHGKDYTPPPRPDRSSKKSAADTTTNKPKGFKKKVKNFPLVGSALRLAAKLVDKVVDLKNEILFLHRARRYTKDLDLLLITGSNQLLDNYGGSWGFPYTLFKWTLLAKSTNTKVGFVSVGAGPLTLPLSFRMLEIALNKADYVSYRDEGSKKLVESKIDIDHPVYPDLAHSLHMELKNPQGTNKESLQIAINPMPVYDHRYWYIADENKYREYLQKIADLCVETLEAGHRLCLFSTQPADSNVIADVEDILQARDKYSDWQASIQINNPAHVHELVNLLNSADIIIATRFHATLLPLQLSKPVIGVCYYRKAAELLDEMGLKDFHVDVDDFNIDELKQMLHKLIAGRQQASVNIAEKYGGYRSELNEQYEKILQLVS